MERWPEVGPWAKQKLDSLARYLDFYTKVLKYQRWRTIYLDAYAGGGRAVIRSEGRQASVGPDLFGEVPAIEPEAHEFIDGSPRVALAVLNPFDRYIFIDPDPNRVDELERLKEEFSATRVIDVLRTSSADGIAWVVEQPISRRTHRGVAFLDPFGTQLDWATVQRLADTGLFEVVINFPLGMAIQRMLPNSGEVPDSWASALDRYFGSRAWFGEVYQERRRDLLTGLGYEKRPDYLERLLELYRGNLFAAFGNVSAPRLIRNTRGSPLYYLVWAGPHKKGLEGADYILRMGELIKVK